MISKVIVWSIKNRILVLLAAFAILFGGLYSIQKTPIDAIPDLSDVQVIVKTSFPGQAPQVVEDQVTYPLTSALLAVPGAHTVRGFSFFGDSYIYIIFDDDTDLYWARSRVLEYLNQVDLPESAKSKLGPDATGVGWIYLYALTDVSNQYSIDELRSLQDWFLKYELQSVEGVAEVATVGGLVKQYQVEVDPQKLRAYNIPLAHIHQAIQRGNQELGASVIEMAEAEYIVRLKGYLESIDTIRSIPLGINQKGTPVLLSDVANIRLGPDKRRGIAELNGRGEVVGGIVVMRSGENAQATIDNVKQRLSELESSLPDGVEVVTVYDRSDLIQRSVTNLWQKLFEEILLVAVICIIFLFHLRSSLVAIISLPMGILAAFIVIYWQGLNANIMSLGGIAIAIGAMIDGAIVMIENTHKHLAKAKPKDDHWQIVTRAATEVGPALFFSLLIITVSFVPIFMLEAQEGRMFTPLAYTKTYAMAAAAALAITLVPVLAGYFVRGNIRNESENPFLRPIRSGYQSLLSTLLNWPKLSLFVAIVAIGSSYYPYQKLGTEFMPELDEGDLMYMPTTYPAISIGKAKQLLQQTDKLIKTVPEVKNVFGKIGRAETATDPAPLTMIETFIQLKPKSEWRKGVTTEDLIKEFETLVQFPGVTNAWVMPIKTRIDMLATGIKTPVGIKIAGPDLNQIQSIGQNLEKLLLEIPGTLSVYSERVVGGRYINVTIDRLKAARYGLNIADIQQDIAMAVGGANISESVEGAERYPINIRYPQAYRNSPEQLAELPLITGSGQRFKLGDVADITLESGPAIIKSENARPNGWTYVDIEDRDLKNYVLEAQRLVAERIDLPVGYSIRWAGQYEYLLRAQERLSIAVPLTLLIIIVLLYLSFKKFTDVVLVLATLPFALVGSFWLMHWLGFNLSVAAGVGFIALAGVAVETSIIMLTFINQRYLQALEQKDIKSDADLISLILAAASLRLRPVLMTAGATIAGLLPILYGGGAGSEIMSRLAAPMVGGMITGTLMTLLLVPVVAMLRYRVVLGREL